MTIAKKDESHYCGNYVELSSCTQWNAACLSPGNRTFQPVSVTCLCVYIECTPLPSSVLCLSRSETSTVQAAVYEVQVFYCFRKEAALEVWGSYCKFDAQDQPRYHEREFAL